MKIKLWTKRSFLPKNVLYVCRETSLFPEFKPVPDSFILITANEKIPLESQLIAISIFLENEQEHNKKMDLKFQLDD